MTNPWNLTPRQCEYMDAIYTHGEAYEAAQALGTTAHTVSTRLCVIRAKMEVKNTTQAAVMWARFRWELEQEQEQAA